MEEIWKDIKGYEGLYQVSNLGRVRRVKKIKIVTNNILKQSKNLRGYLGVTLSKNNVRVRRQIHRLVAEAFIENKNNFSQVNHKDEDKTNNCVDNLEWCDAKYNINYGSGINRRKEKLKGRKPSSKTVEASRKSLSKRVLQFDKNGNFIEKFSSTMDVQRKKGYSNSNISRCCIGKRKSAYGFVWKYEENCPTL